MKIDVQEPDSPVSSAGEQDIHLSTIKVKNVGKHDFDSMYFDMGLEATTPVDLRRDAARFKQHRESIVSRALLKNQMKNSFTNFVRVGESRNYLNLSAPRLKWPIIIHKFFICLF